MRIMGGAQSVGSELFNRFDITTDVILGNRPALAFTVLMIVDSADKTFFAVEIKAKTSLSLCSYAVYFSHTIVVKELSCHNP